MFRRPLIVLLLPLVAACGGSSSSDASTDSLDSVPDPVDTVETGDPLEELTAGLPDKPNVLLVLTDTLRADRTSVYGHERDTTPWLNSWAEDAIVFEQALSANAWTPPSVSALFTGLYTSAHGVTALGLNAPSDDAVLASHHITLAELFQSAGYQTGAIVKSPVPRAEAGFDQGFNSMVTVDGKQAHSTSGEELVAAAKEWLGTHANASEPFFLYTHFMEPHAPYIAPEPYFEMHDEGYDSTVTGSYSQVLDFRNGNETFTNEDVLRLRALYDGELTYWDQQIQSLVGYLTELNVQEETIVAFVGDHGEQFYEHGDWFHGALYQENIHVPLIVQIPGVSGRRVEGPVQMIDLTPTLAGLCGLEEVPHWQARSLASAMVTGETGSEPVYFEYGDDLGLLRQDGMKVSGVKGKAKLFDLSVDPTEQNDLSDDPAYQDLLDEMKAEVLSILTSSRALANELQP